MMLDLSRQTLGHTTHTSSSSSAYSPLYSPILRLHLPADWARACGRGVESCIIVLDNDGNAQQCVDNQRLNHRVVVSIVAMRSNREPAPIARAMPTSQLQSCPRHANHKAEYTTRKTKAEASIQTNTSLQTTQKETQATSNRAKGCDIESDDNQTTRNHACAILSFGHRRSAKRTQQSVHRARGCCGGTLESKDRVGHVRTEQSIERGDA